MVCIFGHWARVNESSPSIGQLLKACIDNHSKLTFDKKTAKTYEFIQYTYIAGLVHSPIYNWTAGGPRVRDTNH